MVPEKMDEGFDRRMPSRRECREADSSGVGDGERRPRDEVNFGTRLGGKPGTGGRERADGTLN